MRLFENLGEGAPLVGGLSHGLVDRRGDAIHVPDQASHALEPGAPRGCGRGGEEERERRGEQMARTREAPPFDFDQTSPYEDR